MIGQDHHRTRLELQAQGERIHAALMEGAERSGYALGEVEPESALIGIVGERGSGKTTLLRHVTEVLRVEDSFEVLPVLRPEILAASSDSLVLAAMNALTAQQQGREITGRSSDALNAIGQQALRSTIFAVGSSIGDLFESSGSLGQFSVDSAAMLGRVSALHEDLKNFVRAYLESTGQRGVVVPVDDIDLLPGSLSKLLLDVRTLASLPGVYPIICLSWDDLRANLRAEVSRSFGNIGAVEVDRLVEQQVMKTLRPDRIFEPLQLPRVDRLAFVPIGESEPLGDVLGATFRSLDQDGRAQLSQWFSDASSGAARTAGFATGWLPGTYRALEHLYYQSQILRRALSQQAGALEAAHQLRAFVDSVARGSGVRRLTLEFQSVDVTNGRAQISATAEWPSYRAGVTAASKWARAYRAGGVRVRLRHGVRMIATEQLPEESTAGKEAGGRREASTGETIGATLAQSLLSSSVFSDPRPAGPLSLGESSCEFLQSVQIVGLPTSDKILLLPASADIVHIDRWFASWNWVVDHAHATARHESPIGPALGALCDATVKLWWGGEDPETTDVSASMIEALEAAAELYVRLVNQIGAEEDWRTSPARSYCEWFELLLPQSFHEALLSRHDLGAALALWQAALASSPTGENALDRLHDLFEGLVDASPGRLGSSIRERIWLFGYRSLVRSLGEGLIISLNQFEKEYRERERKGARGTGAVEESVQLEQESDGYRYASEVTSAGVSQFQAITRLLDQLRRT